MRKRYCLIIIVIIICFFSTGCASEPNLHSQKSGTFSGRRSFEFNNFTLLIADTGKERASFEFRNFTGSGLQAPFNELNMKIGNKIYEVTSKGVGNSHLKVNGVVYAFDSFKEHLLIDRDGKIVPEQGEIDSGLMPHTNSKKTR